MKIVYRIINKDNDEDDCLYELTKNDSEVYLWQYLSRVKYGDDVEIYPTLYLGIERNLNDDFDRNEIAGRLRFELADLGEENAN